MAGLRSRREVFETCPRISAASEPELWELAAQGAQEAGLGVPMEVVIVPAGDVAAVSRRWPVRRRSFLTIGAGALELLDAPGLRAAIADGPRGELLDINSALYVVFLDKEVIPAFAAGARPPLLDGFRHFVESRILHNPDLAPAERSGPPILDLVRMRTRIEVSLANALIGETRARKLVEVSWEELGMERLVPAWRRMADEKSHAFPAGLRLRDLPDAVAALDDAGRRLAPSGMVGEHFVVLGPASESDPVEPTPLEGAREALGALAMTVLADDGWQVSALPGRPFECRNDGLSFSLGVELDALVEGKLSSEEWRSHAEELGIADLPLTPPA